MFEPDTIVRYLLAGSKLDEIATRVYGRKYVGQQTGECISNDSLLEIDLSTDEDLEEELAPWESLDPDRKSWADILAEHNGDPPDYMSEISYPADLEHSGGLGWIRLWLEKDPALYKYDFQLYRLAPEPRIIMADLIRRGELPMGVYLLSVSW